MNIIDDHYLGDDGIVSIPKTNFDINFNLDEFIDTAKRCFNLTLHPEKVVITRPGKEAPFLGYKKVGMRLTRPL